MLGIRNRTEIYRNKSFRQYLFDKNVVVILKDDNKVFCFDAVNNAELNETISESLKCLEVYCLEQVNLMFNGIEILIHEGMDKERAMRKYFEKYNEKSKALKDMVFI